VARFQPKGRVVFDNVTFNYNGAEGDPVLKKICFEAKPGEKVAILGATGSGKSTLVHLIPRFYDVSEGSVCVDGIDVRDLAKGALRERIGTALQVPILFSGTVRDNISYGRPDASEEEIAEAAKTAQAHRFIGELPDGYETRIGQRGVNLSGGQKQRIAIARALLTRPAVLILDDCTSAVDLETEARIQAALEDASPEATRFVIAQRISSVMGADRILVLEDGRVAAQGTHAELMDASAIYREIYESQLGDGR
jgi:ATP-binding cassette subfamily B protein